MISLNKVGGLLRRTVDRYFSVEKCCDLDLWPFDLKI